MDLDVLVIGSINMDVSVLTHRLPRPGETLIGKGHFLGPGGKGANQAVAIARLGGSVGLLGRVGEDEWGRALVTGLEVEGVDVSTVATDPAGTGLAIITIDDDAENTIVASPGANAQLTPETIRQNSSLIARAKVVLAQLEVPVETIEAAAEATDGIFCLNPAPAQPLPPSLLAMTDVLVPNRSELTVLAGETTIVKTDEVALVARRINPSGATIVTLGRDGALLVDDGDEVHYPAHEVRAVDPTGAGDTFCGALALALSRGDDFSTAVPFASAAAAISVTHRGAQAGMPTLAEVESLLAD